MPERRRQNVEADAVADYGLSQLDRKVKQRAKQLPSSARLAREIENFAGASALVGMVFGGWALTTWLIGVPQLTTFPGQANVKANTGLCFVLVGASLYLLRKCGATTGQVRFCIAAICAAMASTIGLLSFIEGISGRDFGIDQLLFRVGAEDALASIRPGLMSPVSGAAFFLLGPALLLIAASRKWARCLQQSLSLLIGSVSMFGLLDFLVDPSRVHTHIAPTTACVLLLLSVAVVVCRPQWGIGALLVSESNGGALARRLLPACMVLPVLIGWLRWQGQTAGLYSEWTGVSVMVISVIVLLSGLTIWTAFALDRSDAERRRGSESMRRLAAIVESSSDAILGKTLEGVITSWNPGAETMYGYSAREMVGRSIETVIPSDRVTEFKNVLRRVASGELVRHYESLRVHKDGRTLPVSLSISPVKDDAGNVIGISTIARDISERKQAEEALRRSEARYRSLITATAQIVWSTNSHGQVEEDMPMWRAFTGMSVEQIAGSGWLNSLHPDDRETTQQVWQKAWQERGQYDTEYRIRRRDGEYRSFAVRGVPVLEEDGSVREWVGTCTDITERKCAEEGLQRVNRTLHVLSESTEALMKANDELDMLQGVCDTAVTVGGYCMAWVGYAREDESKTVEPVGQAGFAEGYLQRANISWADVDRGRGPTGSAIRSGEVVICSDMDSDRSYLPWRENAARLGYRSSIALPLKDENRVFGALTIYARETGVFDEREQRLLGELANNVSYAVMMLRAQTLRKQAEESLRRASLYTRSLIEASLDPLVTISREGKITDVNEATEKVTGVARKRLVGSDFCDYFTQPDEARRGYEQVFANGFVHDYPLAIRHSSGDVTDVLYNATVFRNVQGEIEGVFAAARDITQRKRAEEEIRTLNQELEQRVEARTAELSAANKELEAFTYSVSHDLRAPLRHISGFSRILMEDFAPALPPEAQRHLQRIEQGTTRMGQLVDDLLNLTRVGRREVNLQVSGLDSLVREVIATLEPDSAGRQVDWRVGSLPFVECDSALMKQVFQNLLSNALKFTRPRAQAVIEVGQIEQAGAAVVYVRDNGVGFSMKYADKLFGVFQRLHRAEDFEGTGVGLATVQRIIHKHGGRIWAEAELDKGATFYFTLGDSDTKPQPEEALIGANA